ncbi:hypothetical protein [Haloarcula marina]|uniref:hypothetical protein n=1 Tax=Haloarcula marina TaxID=2961574 RepID=UPI0020B70F16|nr:hypothetical protein [Halomicroarcula marina]
MFKISRRKALSVGGLALGSALAGCAGPAHLGTTELTNPERNEEDGETHFTFRRDGDDYLTLSVLSQEDYRSSVNQLPIRLSVSHRDGTVLNSLTYHLYRADRDQEFSEFYLRTPGGAPFPEMTFQRDSNGRGIRLAVPDLDFQGSGTVSFDFIIEPDRPAESTGPFVLGLNAEFRLSETSPLGRDFKASVSQDVELALSQ